MPDGKIHKIFTETNCQKYSIDDNKSQKVSEKNKVDEDWFGLFI